MFSFGLYIVITILVSLPYFYSYRLRLKHRHMFIIYAFVKFIFIIYLFCYLTSCHIKGSIKTSSASYTFPFFLYFSLSELFQKPAQLFVPLKSQATLKCTGFELTVYPISHFNLNQTITRPDRNLYPSRTFAQIKSAAAMSPNP